MSVFKKRIRKYAPQRKLIFPRKAPRLTKALSDAELQGLWPYNDLTPPTTGSSARPLWG